ncbi:MAG: glycosyltransferase [ANME-2 cluster archaeon]|nr:glycosyltransferase [ANME-2 cluster archaeon]
MSEPILLFYEPRYSSLIGHFNEKLIIYDFIDNRLGFTEVPRWMKYYIELLMKKSDVVTTSSKNLYENALSNGAKKVFLVRNAVDIDHFQNQKHNIPFDIKLLQKPIIGYVGALYEWFDFELIEKIALKFVASSILLIGPVHPEQLSNISALKKYENIHVIGARSYNDLPNYISQFDVAIIPFKVNDLTNYVNPVKLYEYLASDKTVVSTSLPDIFEYEDIVYIAQDHDTFIRAIEKALNNNKKRNYVDFLINNTWDKRAETMIDIIIKYSKGDP